MLITFANSFDPDQAWQNGGPDVDDPNCMTLMVFAKEFFEKVDYKKKVSKRQKQAKLVKEFREKMSPVKLVNRANQK